MEHLNKTVSSGGNDMSSTRQSSDLPFLVTHWLTSYGLDRDVHEECKEQQNADALERIRKATSELSQAFSDLGAFGHTIVVSYSYIIYLS